MNFEPRVAEKPKIRVGISSCLLGAKVRFDGNDKRDRTINEFLGEFFDFCPICPEVDSGLGVPREPVQLVRQDDGSLRVLGVNDPGLDVTERLARFTRSRMADLASLRGYIVKSKSPSCGMSRIPIYSERGEMVASGRGVYTSVLLEYYPLLPVESEVKLHDPLIRENFLERVLIFDRWQALRESGLTLATLGDFHNRHQFLILAHSQAALGRLQRIVAQARPESLEASARDYASGLMKTLRRPVQPGKRAALRKRTPPFA